LDAITGLSGRWIATFNREVVVAESSSSALFLRLHELGIRGAISTFVAGVAATDLTQSLEAEARPT
jgi:uncharacterized membrane protein YjjP (DUF1212 family)